jgi:hypothetical protein
MNSPSTESVSGNTPRGRFSLRTACVAMLVGAAATGCGVVALEAELRIASKADYDHYFYNVPSDEIASAERIDENIERLAGPGWQQAKAKLFCSGREAMVRLINNMDRAEPTRVGLISVPGRQVPERATAWPLGAVVYSVLVEFVGAYTDYEGPIPSADKAQWETWLKRQRGLKFKRPIDTAPKYVRQQFVANEIAMQSRFGNVRAKAKKAEAEAARARKKAQQERAAAERKRKADAKARRAEAQKAAAKEAAEKKAAKRDDARRAAAEEKAKKEAEAREKEPPREEPKPKEEPKRSRRSRRRRRD